mgnify:CR=1 FL=1
MAKTKFVVGWALSHSGKDYKKGDEVSLDEKDAGPLLQSGVISKKEKAQKKVETPKVDDTETSNPENDELEDEGDSVSGESTENQE